MTTMTTVNVHTMPLRELGRMTREQVDALSEADRLWRRETLSNDETPWGINRMYVEFGMTSRHAVARWRNNFLRTGVVSANALVEPDAGEEDVRTHGDGNEGKRTGSPLWKASTVRKWGVDSERMDEDYVPRPGGRKPPGRTPKPKPKPAKPKPAKPAKPAKRAAKKAKTAAA